MSKYEIKDLALEDGQRTDKIKSLIDCLILTNEQTQRVGRVFKNEMALALAEKPSSLQMENTYIPELPDGTEEGIYLALDLGGTNFRVILLELINGIIVREIIKPYDITDELRLGCGIKLFDYLAKCLSEFVIAENLENIELPLGFTFSFPMKQHSLNSGSLVTWTKSFNCSSVVGEDVVRLLQESLEVYGHNHINVLAILNDTTGTLVEGARVDKRTRIGIVLGTGSNACYVENAECVQHWETERHGEKNVIIDIEWGAFGDNGTLNFIKTIYDHEVDNGSLLVNSFTFEKYISGKYLGELQRVILKKLWNENLLFQKYSDSEFLLSQPWSFASDNVSRIDGDNLENTITNTQQIFENLGFVFGKDFDLDDIKIIKYISALISIRAAKLVSINTSILLNRMNDSDIVIAIDGSLYKHHPRLNGWLEMFIKEMTYDKNFQLKLVEDGSGKGAGLAAAIAVKLKNRV